MKQDKKVEPTKAQLVREVEAKLGFRKFELNSLERANKATIVALLVRQRSECKLLNNSKLDKSPYWHGTIVPKFREPAKVGFLLPFRDSKYLLRED